MVSGPLVGDEGSNKAYPRKTQNKSKNLNHVLHHSSLRQGLTELGGGALASNDPSCPNGLAEPDNGPRGYSNFGNMIRIRLDSQSKADLREIKWQLMSELEQVRCLVNNFEAKEDRYVQSPLSDNDAIDNVKTTMRVDSEMGSVGLRDSGPYPGLNISVGENHIGCGHLVEKENRKSKANQGSRNSEFHVGKEKPPPSGSSKKLKSTGRARDEGVEPRFGSGKNSSRLFQSCSALLDKLMKHKFGWVFRKPVDAKALGLHDYHTIIKKPMDLGTVKTRLNENWYKTPSEFAEDVRLTFNNAMLYNPKEQDAHLMAEQLLKMFEDKWTDIEAEYNLNRRNEMGNDSNLPPPVSRKVQTAASPPPLPFKMKTLDRAESVTEPVDPKVKPVSSGRPSRPPVPKKPKAKDPEKRDMTYEEKQRLSKNLQMLPSEKLDNIVQIIRKRNPGLSQQEDEVEVDIEVVDPETLWELDRFVTNYRKSLNKNKRKADLGPQSIAEPGHVIKETNVEPAATVEAEEVESVRREEPGDNVSGSSSSGSESGSSSSDSDNDSSSGCESDSNH